MISGSWIKESFLNRSSVCKKWDDKEARDSPRAGAGGYIRRGAGGLGSGGLGVGGRAVSKRVVKGEKKEDHQINDDDGNLMQLKMLPPSMPSNNYKTTSTTASNSSDRKSTTQNGRSGGGGDSSDFRYQIGTNSSNRSNHSKSSSSINENLTPRTFLEKYSLPRVVHVVPQEPVADLLGSSDPITLLNGHLLMYKQYRSGKVEARNFSETRLGQKHLNGNEYDSLIVIPDSFQGWFSVVTERGQVKAKVYNSMNRLVSAHVTLFLTAGPDIIAYSQNNRTNSDGSRQQYCKSTVKSGQVLKLLAVYEDISNQSTRTKRLSWPLIGGRHEVNRYAQCLSSTNQVLYIPISTHGLFYAISTVSNNSEENVSKVYQLPRLLRTFPLPVRVCIISSTKPQGSMLLESYRKEDVILACVLDNASNSVKSRLSFNDTKGKSDEYRLLEIDINSKFFIKRPTEHEHDELRLLKSPKVQRALRYCQENGEKWCKQLKIIHYIYPENVIKELCLSHERSIESNKKEKKNRRISVGDKKTVKSASFRFSASYGPEDPRPLFRNVNTGSNDVVNAPNVASIATTMTTTSTTHSMSTCDSSSFYLNFANKQLINKHVGGNECFSLPMMKTERNIFDNELFRSKTSSSPPPPPSRVNLLPVRPNPPPKKPPRPAVKSPIPAPRNLPPLPTAMPDPPVTKSTPPPESLPLSPLNCPPLSTQKFETQIINKGSELKGSSALRVDEDRLNSGSSDVDVSLNNGNSLSAMERLDILTKSLSVKSRNEETKIIPASLDSYPSSETYSQNNRIDDSINIGKNGASSKLNTDHINTRNNIINNSDKKNSDSKIISERQLVTCLNNLNNHVTSSKFNDSNNLKAKMDVDKTNGSLVTTTKDANKLKRNAPVDDFKYRVIRKTANNYSHRLAHHPLSSNNVETEQPVYKTRLLVQNVESNPKFLSIPCTTVTDVPEKPKPTVDKDSHLKSEIPYTNVADAVLPNDSGLSSGSNENVYAEIGDVYPTNDRRYFSFNYQNKSPRLKQLNLDYQSGGSDGCFSGTNSSSNNDGSV